MYEYIYKYKKTIFKAVKFKPYSHHKFDHLRME